MMIKNVKLLVSLFVLLPFLSFAQEEEEEDFYTPKSSKELQIGGGMTKLGFYFHLDMGRQLAPRWVLKGSLAMELAKSSELAFTSYFFKPGIYFVLNNPQHKVHLNVAAGGLGMYAAFKESKEIVSGTKTKGTNFGVYFGPELDIQFTETILLNAHFHQAYLPMEFMGTTMYFVGAGLKFKF